MAFEPLPIVYPYPLYQSHWRSFVRAPDVGPTVYTMFSLLSSHLLADAHVSTSMPSAADLTPFDRTLRPSAVDVPACAICKVQDLSESLIYCQSEPLRIRYYRLLSVIVLTNVHNHEHV